MVLPLADCKATSEDILMAFARIYDDPNKKKKDAEKPPRCTISTTRPSAPTWLALSVRSTKPMLGHGDPPSATSTSIGRANGSRATSTRPYQPTPRMGQTTGLTCLHVGRQPPVAHASLFPLHHPAKSLIQCVVFTTPALLTTTYPPQQSSTPKRPYPRADRPTPRTALAVKHPVVGRHAQVALLGGQVAHGGTLRRTPGARLS
jgi:hypothetical protein